MIITKAGNNKALAVLVLDGSSSMGSCIESTISGFNEFLKTQRDSDIETNVSVYTFHGSEVRTIHENVPAISVPELTKYTYQVHGMTNLLDSIGHAITRTNYIIKDMDNPPSVIICVLTDGEENSSRRFNYSGIRELVKSCEAAEWAFMFLGANINAFSVGSTMGFNASNTLQYDTHNMGAMATSVSLATERVKLSRSRNESLQTSYASMFTDADRKNNGL